MEGKYTVSGVAELFLNHLDSLFELLAGVMSSLAIMIT